MLNQSTKKRKTDDGESGGQPEAEAGFSGPSFPKPHAVKQTMVFSDSSYEDSKEKAKEDDGFCL